jgi:uncharacterized protein involved in oxidation of intracellular sulfur
MQVLFILNDSPHASRRSYNGLRLAVSLARSSNNQVRVFLLGDGVICALAGVNPADASYNVQELFRQLTQRDVPVGVCRTCMEQRGLPDTMMIEGARRSTMDDLTAWTEEADKVLVF